MICYSMLQFSLLAGIGITHGFGKARRLGLNTWASSWFPLIPGISRHEISPSVNVLIYQWPADVDERPCFPAWCTEGI